MLRQRFARYLLAPVAVLGFAACGGGGGTPMTFDSGNGGDDAPSGPDATPAPYCSPRAGTSLRLQLITDDLENPVTVAAPPADPRLFIVEQPGRIRVVKNGLLLATPFLSIDTQDLGDEQGLLGLAFHPDYASNGRFFVFYVRPGGQPYTLRIAEYHAETGADTAQPTEKVILDIGHAYDNHNGGTLAFGPDGFLYLSTGDGGGGDDTLGSGQNPDTRLSKVLRIDVDTGNPYGIPAGNPWANGTDGVAEMFAWGLRNPYRFSIDSSTGDVWVGDVGQGTYEEVDVVRSGSSGQNFGWPVFEGPDCFTADQGGSTGCNTPGNYTLPVTAYNRVGTGQCSVIGGHVYRGTCMPDMAGRYVFGDYCSGEVRSFPASSSTVAFNATTDHTDDLDPTDLLYGRLSGFGVDGYNELYATALQTGAVYRIEVE